MSRTRLTRACFGALAVLLSQQLSAAAADLVADLSKNRVAIRANFSGDRILLFGAIAPGRPDSNRQVIATIEGPSQNIMLRKKARTGGIWVNRGAVRIDNVPSYYAVMSSAPLLEIANRDTLSANGIGARNLATRLQEQNPDISAAYAEALLRLKRDQKLYTDAPALVDITEARLFRTEIDLPSGIMIGTYNITYFLIENGRVIETRRGNFEVDVVGLEQFLYSTAHRQPFLYGLLGVFLACGMGWAAARFLGRS